MALVYRLQCTQCHESPQVSGDVAGYVNMDGKKGGRILPGGYLALKRVDGSYACLPHPIESSSLQAEGFTRKQAAREERLFRVTYKICRKCGVIHEEYRHCSDPFAGCLAGIIAFAATLLASKFALGFAWFSSAGFACVAFYGLGGVFDQIERRGWRLALSEKNRP